SGITRHLGDEVEVHRDHGGAQAYAGACASRFTARMTGADDHDVVAVLHCYHCSGMRVLVIGSGGREHALCWKLAQSEGVEIFANPGNPGMALVGTCVPGDALAAAESVKADLTVVGPEVPLVAGIVDQFRAKGL